MRTIHTLLTPLLLLAAGAGCGPPRYELTLTGSSSSSGRLSITSGGQVSGSDLAVDLHFGTLRDGGAGRRFTYFVLLRPTAASTGSMGAAYATTVEDGHALDELTLRRGERELAIRVTARWEGEEAVAETLEVDGEARDPEAGRVFLAELSGERPAVRQLDLELPAELPEDWSPAEMRGAVLKALERLRASSAAVREFAGG